jgi:PAS domain S-box-containing protein
MVCICASDGKKGLQALLDRAPEAVFIKGRGGRHLYMNEHCARILGLKHGDALNRTAFQLFHPKLAEQFRANAAAYHEAGEPACACNLIYVRALGALCSMM